MPKDNIRDKLEGNVLDLSLNNLSVVPVREMSQLVKGTNVDLSCNLLTTLPPDFCDLRHIVRLDLSKNHLQSLPDDLGNLHKLQHLDLFGNQLTTLPVSTFMLKSLKWLDLRDNPLEDGLRKVAGDCLNEAECKKCAKNVVEYLRGVQAVMERSKQKQLQEERELERIKKAELEAEEERERQQKKVEKLAEKERRRAEYQAKQAAKQEQTQSSTQSEHTDHQTHSPVSSISDSTTAKADGKSKVGLSCCGVFLTSLLGFMLVLGIAFYYCNTHYTDPLCMDVKRTLMPYWTHARKLLDDFTQKR